MSNTLKYIQAEELQVQALKYTDEHLWIKPVGDAKFANFEKYKNPLLPVVDGVICPPVTTPQGSDQQLSLVTDVIPHLKFTKPYI